MKVKGKYGHYSKELLYFFKSSFHFGSFTKKHLTVNSVVGYAVCK